jgi:ATP-dependent 26S proteasome regulatory subunit
VTYDAAILEKDYVFAQFIEGESNVMVMEDADTFLKARSDGNSMMHRFLNVGDGLVTTKGKKLIFSTNLPSIRDVDSALIRPGRCFDILEFNSLTQEQAEKVASKSNIKLDRKDKWSIAEIFNKEVSAPTNKSMNRKVGFV